MGTVNLLSFDCLVVGFGYRSKHGKDTAAAAIMERFGHGLDIRRYAFADALKVEVFDALASSQHPYWAWTKLNYFDFPHPQLPLLSSFGKLQWVEWNKHLLGPLLQEYGTEYIRAGNPFYWIGKVRDTLERERPRVALVTDVRFPNEMSFIKACKGYTVKVTREGYENSERNAFHASEVLLSNEAFDYEITVPDGERRELEADACDLFQVILDLQQPDIPEFNDEEAVHIHG